MRSNYSINSFFPTLVEKRGSAPFSNNGLYQSVENYSVELYARGLFSQEKKNIRGKSGRCEL